MNALTTRQRDLLYTLMATSDPLGVANLAAATNLTPRQVNYCLKGLRKWLACRKIDLKSIPGVGFELLYSEQQASNLRDELSQQDAFLLILSVEERQQLLLIALLNATEPFILYQLQQKAAVSRSTILKDLDSLQTWCDQHGLVLQRRPNYGIWIEAGELGRRQALTSLLLGQAQLGPPVVTMSHTHGLTFPLGDDAQLLPLADDIARYVHQIETVITLEAVALAEALLGGRYTDDAVLFLAVALAVQQQRIQQGQTIEHTAQEMDWLRELAVWRVAERLAGDIVPKTMPYPDQEIATIAILLLIAPRNERWPGDLEINKPLRNLVDSLMRIIAELYKRPEMEKDRTLRDGIVIHVVPACLRVRFGLQMMVNTEPSLPAGFEFEQSVARLLLEEIDQLYSISLPESEVANLALLLRAAHIRERPAQQREVWIVCPSGMATAQLLLARLKMRFPRLVTTKVISVRELGRAAAYESPLIITTVPLPGDLAQTHDVIQVHPLLLPEDIERITQFLA